MEGSDGLGRDSTLEELIPLIPRIGVWGIGVQGGNLCPSAGNTQWPF